MFMQIEQKNRMKTKRTNIGKMLIFKAK